MNCHECTHVGSIPGNAHKKCVHPDVSNLQIKANPHGIRSGWVCHPAVANGFAMELAGFDPTWINECDGFTTKEKPND